MVYPYMTSDPSTGINNLDLNNDGNVDYLNVTEYQNNGNGIRRYGSYAILSNQLLGPISL